MENNDRESNEFRRFKVLEMKDIVVNSRESEVEMDVEVFKMRIKGIDDMTEVIDRLVIEIADAVSDMEMMPLRGLDIPRLVIAMLVRVIVVMV